MYMYIYTICVYIYIFEYAQVDANIFGDATTSVTDSECLRNGHLSLDASKAEEFKVILLMHIGQ